jgi:hypothetical protein
MHCLPIQRAQDDRTDDEGQQQRRDRRANGAKRDVRQNVEAAVLFGERQQEVEKHDETGARVEGEGGFSSPSANHDDC